MYDPHGQKGQKSPWRGWEKWWTDQYMTHVDKRGWKLPWRAWDKWWVHQFMTHIDNRGRNDPEEHGMSGEHISLPIECFLDMIFQFCTWMLGAWVFAVLVICLNILESVFCAIVTAHITFWCITDFKIKKSEKSLTNVSPFSSVFFKWLLYLPPP